MLTRPRISLRMCVCLLSVVSTCCKTRLLVENVMSSYFSPKMLNSV